MELYLEVVITGLLSVLLAFLLGKLFSDGGGGSTAGDDRGSAPLRSDQNPAPNPSPDPKEKCDETEPDDTRSEGVDKVYSFLFEGDARPSDVEIREEEEKEEDAVESRDEEAEGSKRVGDDDEKGDEAISEDEEWEGIERNEVEEKFREAVAFVDGMGGELALLGFGDDEKMQLFGLRKVAMEGPCYESQPMALKLSARSKWNAWQILGNMNPDVAMEQYTSILSMKIPGWMREKPKEDVEKHVQNEGSEEKLTGSCMPGSCLNTHNQPSVETDRKGECSTCIDDENESTSSDHVSQGSTGTKS